MSSSSSIAAGSDADTAAAADAPPSADMSDVPVAAEAFEISGAALGPLELSCALAAVPVVSTALLSAALTFFFLFLPSLAFVIALFPMDLN